MAMKNNRNYIAQMNKGMKQKLSMLLIACLLFTGYHGLTISGRAEQEEKEQTNEISVSGTQVKVQLLGEDIRRAAKEAIEKGDRVEGAALQGYSGDEDLQKEYAEIFSSEKEVYEIPLDSISEGLSESLAEEEAGLQVFVERDAKDLERLVRKESKESLLLYDKNSQLTQLFPKNNQEETKATVEKEQESGAEEALASDSNIEKPERNTELTGSELITFLYKNKADHRISFQLSVDGNTYPKVVVSPKTQLFKSFLDKLKKEEKKPQAETTVVASTEAKESTAAESTETEVTASSEETEESESESAASSVSLVSTEGSSEETTVLESTVVETAEAESAEESAETKEHTTEVTEETEATEETAAESKAAEAAKEKKENFTGFLQEVISHYEEFLGELETARFAQYSLNELGRKTQNVEIKDFVTVEVFYDEDAFDEDVVLEAKRLVKPEEEGEKEGEKLTKEQIKLMQESGIYDDTDSLDIRFVSKKNKEKEVEPKENYTVTVRLTFDKKAVPEEATADTIAIHHIVEKDGKEQYVETVLRSVEEKQSEIEDSEVKEVATEELSEEEHGKLEDGLVAEENSEKEEKKNEGIEIITKEFVVNSFSAYIVHWKGGDDDVRRPIRFHFVNQNFKEIAPTVYISETWLSPDSKPKVKKERETVLYQRVVERNRFTGQDEVKYNFKWEAVNGQIIANHNLLQIADGYEYKGLFGQSDQRVNELYNGTRKYDNNKNEFISGEVEKLTNKNFKLLNDRNNYSFEKNCAYHEFYFMYHLYPKPNCKIKSPSVGGPSLLHDKYITKFIEGEKNGTYDLTLTAQPGRNKANDQKTKLDLLIIYDNSGNISLEDDKKTKKSLYDLMDRLASEKSGFDARFALVSMNGEENNPSINSTNRDEIIPYDPAEKEHIFNKTNEMLNGIRPIAGMLGDLRRDGLSPNFKKSVKDGRPFRNVPLVEREKLYDDLRTYQFSDKETIKRELKALENKRPKSGKGTGANFAAAIRDAKSLMNYWDKKGNPRVHKDEKGDLISDFGYFQASERYIENLDQVYSHPAYDPEKRKKTNNDNLVWTDQDRLVREGDDVKTVVIMVAGGNPSKMYVPKDGVYETFVKDNNNYYLTRAPYTAGESIGNGDEIYYPALNAAKFELKYFVSLNAFYTIGVGDASKRDKIPELLGALPYENLVHKEFDASNVNKLEDSFKTLLNEISETRIHSVRIEDVLSENVELVNGKSSLRGELVKKKDNNVEDEHILSEEERITKGLNKIVVDARFDDSKKRTVISLQTEPADYVVPLGYELRLVANIKPTKAAYENINKLEMIHEGDRRTDLNDIHNLSGLHKRGDDAVYGTSAKKPGLYTNDEATVKYKYCDKCGSHDGPTEKYNKPIINVERKGFLKIYKIFSGLDNKFVDKSSGKLSNIGKQVLQQTSFKIYQKEGTEEKLLTTINLGDELWINDDDALKNGKSFKTKDGYEVYIHPIEKNKTEAGTELEGHRFVITINGLPADKEYKIVEEQANSNIVKERDTDEVGYQFIKKDGNESFNPMNESVGGIVYHFTNTYEPKSSLKKITLKKVVEEFGGTAFTDEAKKDEFDFDIAFYKRDGLNDVPLNADELEPIVQALETKYPKKTFEISVVSHKLGNHTRVSTIHFQLHHDESIEIAFNPNYSFRIFEEKKDGYESAKVDTMKGNTNGNIGYQEEKLGRFNYTYTELTTNQGQTVVFKNPRITVVPTGLRGDLTPYLFSIFGFTLMAGAYFTINKKKRREI